LTVIGIYTFYISDDPYFLKGAEQATILKNNDETVIALVNGEAITKELFESRFTEYYDRYVNDLIARAEVICQ